MLNEKIISLMNEQINKEFYSAYLYLNFANFYEAKGLTGFSSWFRIQAKEEEDHGMLFYRFLQDNNAPVHLTAISAPNHKCEKLEDPLFESLKHEQFVTASINKIYAQALEDKDYRSMEFLNWFIKEQLEEETAAQSLITKMQLFGSDCKGLYMLDSELGTRTYSVPDIKIS
ncbi:MAG: ferritin [Treponema sp.]|nr:ferritin [Treponema sp.]